MKYLLASACLAAMLCLAIALPATAADSVTIDDRMVFPESLGATANGTLYIGSMGTARVYRAKPGQAYAEPFITKEQGQFTRVLGVLPDSRTNTLYVCDAPALKLFALDSGKLKASYPLPDKGSTCNDIALKNGDAYITDTGHGRILKLSKGALTTWYSYPDDPSFDGLVWAKDGNLYINTYRGNHLMRVAVNKDGSAGAMTVLNTSLPLFQPDGMRLSSDGRIILVEGQGRPGASLTEGRVSEVTVKGDTATLRVLKSGFELPTAVTPVGNKLWVLEAKLDYQRNADLKNKDPGSFKVIAIPAK